jgi:hypothetical protein
MDVPTDVPCTLAQPTWPVIFASLKTVGNLLGHSSEELKTIIFRLLGFSEHVTSAVQKAPGRSFEESVQSQLEHNMMFAKSLVENGHKRKTRAAVKNNKFLMTRELSTLSCCSEECFIRDPQDLSRRLVPGRPGSEMTV